MRCFKQKKLVQADILKLAALSLAAANQALFLYSVKAHVDTQTYPQLYTTDSTFMGTCIVLTFSFHVVTVLLPTVEFYENKGDTNSSFYGTQNPYSSILDPLPPSV